MKMEKNFNPKNMDENMLKSIFKDIVKKIKKKPIGFFKLKKMNRTRGMWNSGDDISIDHRREIVPTIVHEMLHDIYEDNSETWVRTVESKISQIMTTDDVFILLKEFIDKLETSKNKSKYFEL